MSEDDIIRIVKEKSSATQDRLDAILLMASQYLPVYFDVLEDILNDHEDKPDIRSAVALALGKIGRSKFSPPEKTLEVLRSHACDTDVTVKNYVIQALGMLGTSDAAPTLINALKDKSNIVFASAAEALGRLGEPVGPYLTDLVVTGADDARCVAAWQLGEIRYRGAVNTLASVVKEDENIEVKALAIWALGQIGVGTPEVMSVLNWAKEQADPDIRLRAEPAIKKIVRHSN